MINLYKRELKEPIREKVWSGLGVEQGLVPLQRLQDYIVLYAGCFSLCIKNRHGAPLLPIQALLQRFLSMTLVAQRFSVGFYAIFAAIVKGLHVVYLIRCGEKTGAMRTPPILPKAHCTLF